MGAKGILFTLCSLFNASNTEPVFCSNSIPLAASQEWVGTAKQCRPLFVSSIRFARVGQDHSHCGSSHGRWEEMARRMMIVTIMLWPDVNAQRCQLPLLTSASLWKKSGRWSKLGEELLRMTDRKK